MGVAYNIFLISLMRQVTRLFPTFRCWKPSMRKRVCLPQRTQTFGAEGKKKNPSFPTPFLRDYFLWVKIVPSYRRSGKREGRSLSELSLVEGQAEAVPGQRVGKGGWSPDRKEHLPMPRGNVDEPPRPRMMVLSQTQRCAPIMPQPPDPG